MNSLKSLQHFSLKLLTRDGYDFYFIASNPKLFKAHAQAIEDSINELKTFLSWAKVVDQLSDRYPDSLDYLQSSWDNFGETPYINFALVAVKSGELIDQDPIFVVSCSIVSLQYDKAEIGYWCNSKFAGQGFTKLAVEQLIKLIKPYYSEFLIKARLDNIRSQNLALALGFVVDDSMSQENNIIYSKNYQP